MRHVCMRRPRRLSPPNLTILTRIPKPYACTRAARQRHAMTARHEARHGARHQPLSVTRLGSMLGPIQAAPYQRSHRNVNYLRISPNMFLNLAHMSPGV